MTSLGVAADQAAVGWSAAPRAMRFASSSTSMKTTKAILWRNLETLMIERWGKSNLTRLAREADIGATSLYRLRGKSTSVRIDLVERLANALRCESWQLLHPHPQSTEVLEPRQSTLSAVSAEVGKLFEEIEGEAQRARAFALVAACIEFARTGNSK
jgi:DNA-binding Xre family transcriptional regulator